MVKDEKPQIGYLLKHAQSVLHARMDEALRPLGLGVSHYVCLHFLNLEPGISAAELARGAFVTRQSMNALLQGLQDRGLVERPARPTSGRALPAMLTSSGAAVLAAAETAVDGVEQRMLAGLDASDTAALGRGLSACAAALADTERAG